jgi:hypothetical protein
MSLTPAADASWLRLRARGLLQTALKIGVDWTEDTGVVEEAPEQASGARLPDFARRLLLKIKNVCLIWIYAIFETF